MFVAPVTRNSAKTVATHQTQRTPTFTGHIKIVANKFRLPPTSKPDGTAIGSPIMITIPATGTAKTLAMIPVADGRPNTVNTAGITPT